MKKDLNYYLNLNYPIELTQIPREQGGGYSAAIPQLGKYAFLADGDTIENAINDLNRVKGDWFKTYLERGTHIPEPEQEDEEDEYSGKFVLRIPKELHKVLVQKARRNNVSLNLYATHLLSTATTMESCESLMQEFSARVNEMFKGLKTITYNFLRSNAILTGNTAEDSYKEAA